MLQTGAQTVRTQGPRPVVDPAYERPRVDREELQRDRREQRERSQGGKRYTVDCPRALRYASINDVLTVLQSRNVTFRIDVERLSSTNGLMDGQDAIVHSFELTSDRSYADMATLGEELARFGFVVKPEQRA
jgi:hypothetical protein